MSGEYSIKVYTSGKLHGNPNDVVFEINVDNIQQVTDHIRRLGQIGYHRVSATDTVEWIPPHSISRIEANGPGLQRGYTDTNITP